MLRWSIVGAIGVVLLLVAAGAPSASPGARTPVPGDRSALPAWPPATSPAHRDLARTASPGLPYVQSTLFVGNGSRYPGVATPPNILPQAVAWDAASGQIALTASTESEIALVDPTNGSVSGFVGTGAVPDGPLVIPPGSDIAYLGTGSTSPALASVNLTNGALGFSTPLVSAAVGLAWDPIDSQLLVAEEYGTVAAVNATSGAIVVSRSTGELLTSAALDPSSNRLLLTSNDLPGLLVNGSTLLNVSAVPTHLGFDASLYDAATGDFYVTDWTGDNVSVLSGQTGAALGSLPVGGGPNSLADTANGSTLYVANALTDNVTAVPLGAGGVSFSSPGGSGNPLAFVPAPTQLAVILPDQGIAWVNATTGGRLGQVRTGWQPQALAVDGSGGRLFVTEPGMLDQLDLATNGTVGPEIAVGPSPLGVEFDNATQQLFVADYAGNLTVYNATLGRTSASIPVGSYPTTPAGVPGLSELFVGDGLYAPMISVVSTRSDTVTASTPVPCGILCLDEVNAVGYSPMTGDVYAVDSYGVLTAFDPSSLAVLGAAGVGRDPSTIVASPGNASIYVGNYFSDNISIVDGATMQARGNYSLAGGPLDLALDPSNGYLFVTEYGLPQLTVIDTVTGGVLENLSLPAAGEWIAYDPVRDLVYVSQPSLGTVSVVDPNTPPPTLASVAVAPTSVALEYGATADLNATAVNSLGAPIGSGVQFTWASQPPGLGSLTATAGPSTRFIGGSVNATGTLWVNASFGGRTAGATVAVAVTAPTGPTLASVSISPPSALLPVGGSQPFVASALLSDGTAAPSATVYQWSLSPAGLGSLNRSSGADLKFTSSVAGTGTLQVQATYQGITASATATLNVSASPIPVLASVAVLPAALNLTVGGSALLFALAISQTGTNLTASAEFQWAAVPASLGNLTVIGPSTARFVASHSPGAGTLVVTGTFGSVSQRGSSSVDVLAAATPPSSTPPAWPGGATAGVPNLALAALALAVVAVAVVVIGRGRRGKARATPTTGDPAPPESAPDG